MLEELGISGGTAIIILIALYFIIKWGVKNGIMDAYEEIKDNLDKNSQNEEPENIKNK